MNFPAIILTLLVLSSGLSGAGGTDKDHVTPPITEVQRRALQYARLEASEISSLKRRARLSAFLPQLQIDYQRRVRSLVDVNINESVYVGSGGVVVGPDEGEYAYNNNADQNIGVKAIWRLNETVFNPDMLDVSAETRRLAHERQAVLAEVTKNYYDRQRIVGDIAYLKNQVSTAPNPNKVRHEIFLREVASREATAAIDALTGGWFSEQLKTSR